MFISLETLLKFRYKFSPLISAVNVEDNVTSNLQHSRRHRNALGFITWCPFTGVGCAEGDRVHHLRDKLNLRSCDCLIVCCSHGNEAHMRSVSQFSRAIWGKHWSPFWNVYDTIQFPLSLVFICSVQISILWYLIAQTCDTKRQILYAN